jgi:SHS2 domain-containing protein
MSSSYNFIDHTADAAVVVTADTIEELFIASADAFKEVVIESASRKPNESYKLELSSLSLENLLVNFLNELNFRLIYKRKMFSNVNDMKISQNEDIRKLECNLLESDIDESMIKTEIKSVTYHQMDLAKTNEGYKTIIVFDI